MINPLDSSDLANLVLADWHEEYGDIDYANEIRESVLEPKVNNWSFIDEINTLNGIVRIKSAVGGVVSLRSGEPSGGSRAGSNMGDKVGAHSFIGECNESRVGGWD